MTTLEIFHMLSVLLNFFTTLILCLNLQDLIIYLKQKQNFETKCKNFFLEVSKPYSEYLKNYFKLV